jgi:hypothetical protein
MGPDGEWVDLDPEAEAAAAEAAAVTAALAGAAALDLAISRADGTNVAVLSRPPSMRGLFFVPVAVRPVLEPAATGQTYWSRARILRHAAAQGLVVEEKRPDGEWIDLDPEAEAAAVMAAAVTAALAGAAALDLAISRADGTNVAVLSRHPSAPGLFFVPGAVRPVLEPAATGQTYWSRATVLRHAAAQGLVVEEMQPDGEWVRLDA